MQKTIEKTPRQARSLKTHNALLDAAERLLKNRPWEEISTVAIMLEAGVSNGAIYGRFKSKDDLLVALYERHDARLKSRFKKNLSSRMPRNGETIEAFLEREIDQLALIMRENRWMLRAMGLLSRQKPEVVTQLMRGERRSMFEQIAASFIPFNHAIEGPDSERRIEITIFYVSTILREAILYPGPHFGTLDMSGKELRDSVKEMALRFLGADPKASAKDV